MQKYLTLDKGGQASERKTISQADMNAVAEQGMQIFSREPDGTWRRLRVRAEQFKDPRVPGSGRSYEIDLWEPIAGVDPAIEAAAESANKKDAQVQGLKVQRGGAMPTQQNRVREAPDVAHGRGVAPAELIAAGMNKHDPAMKEAAARMAAGNALADTNEVPQDGQPGPGSSTPAAKSQEELAAEQRAAESGQNDGPTQGPKSDAAKPASPSPSITPMGSSAPGSKDAPKPVVRQGK